MKFIKDFFPDELVPLFRREITRLWTQKEFFFLVLIWPLIYGLLLGAIYSEKVVTKMPVAVVDLDHSNISRKLVRFLDASRSFQVDHISDQPEDLQDLIFQNKIVAGIFIPRDLEKNLKRGSGQVITAFVNGANLLPANICSAELQTIIGTVAGGIKLNYLRKTGQTKEKAMALFSPVRVDTAKLFNPSFNYLNYLSPGLWMAALHQIILLLGSLLIVRELDNHTYSELLHLSQKKIHLLMASKLIPHFLIMLITFEVFFRLMFPFFNIPFHGNVTLMVIYSSVFIAAVLSLGFFLSCIFQRGIDSIKGVLLVGAPAFLLSGYTWPVSSMPFFLKPFVYLIPLTTYLNGFRKIYQQDASWYNITTEFSVLLLMACFYLVFSFIVLKLRLKKERT